MIESILLVIAGYLIGSIPFALIVGKLFYKTDVRNHGSGNLGGTNTFRVLGKKAGLLVSVGDVLKGTLAASLPLLLGLDVSPWIAGVPAVVGHCYPLFAKFKGGKAVATSGGVILASSWPIFIVIFLGFILTLKLTKYVSLSSIIIAVLLHGVMICYGDKHSALATFFLLILVIYRHRANIARIVEKTEPKIKWM